MLGNKRVSTPKQTPLNIIPIHSPVIYPGVKARIYISDLYDDTINSLLDTKGYFILSYFENQGGEQIYPTASIVSIEDYKSKVQAFGSFKLKVKDALF